MTQCAIFKDNDGTVSQMIVADGVDIHAHAKELANGRPYAIVARADLPTEHEFFNAWELDTATGTVVPNMTKAKAIAHDTRRAKRDEAFAPLDRQATVPALLTAVEAKRKVIRDADAKLQLAIDAAISTADLKALV